MPYELNNRLVVGIASSALFDLTESDDFFHKQGEAEYRKYQEEHLDDQLLPGIAFAFVQRLLRLNDLQPDDPPVEVIILSKNDPITGLRVMRSVASHSLNITRAVFTQGKSPYEYISAFSMSLFLSASETDVRQAMALGFPSGQVIDSISVDDADGGALRVAFDFDGVIADDGSERIFRDGGGLPAFQAHELAHLTTPLKEGPLRQLLKNLNRIQILEEKLRLVESGYIPRLRIAIVTARNAPAHERAVRTLESWGVTVNDAFFLGGIDKGKVLEVMRPHIFFDDQTGHLKSTARYAASVHIPYGIANETTDDGLRVGAPALEVFVEEVL
jgi:5'-nucleotidase